MKLAISFLMTNFQAMRDHWLNNSVLSSEGRVGTNKPIGKSVDLGGIFTILDWDQKESILEKKLSCPAGFCNIKNGYAINSMRKDQIYLLDEKLNEIGQINNPYFNDLHSIERLENNNFLLTSSGLDAILEVDRSGETVYAWWAHENGYKNDQFGNKIKINKDSNYNLATRTTLNQSTHVNSAIKPSNREDILIASLFHQGKIVEINKSTGEVNTLVDNLKNPHAVHETTPNNYIASDTRNGRIISFDETGKISNEIYTGSNWLQDTCLLSNGNFIAADSNGHRLIELTKDGVVVDEYNFSLNRRIYAVKEII